MWQLNEDNWWDHSFCTHTQKKYFYIKEVLVLPLFMMSLMLKNFFLFFFIVNTLLLYRIQINTWLYRHKNLLMCNKFSLDLYGFFPQESYKWFRLCRTVSNNWSEVSRVKRRSWRPTCTVACACRADIDIYTSNCLHTG